MDTDLAAQPVSLGTCRWAVFLSSMLSVRFTRLAWEGDGG